MYRMYVYFNVAYNLEPDNISMLVQSHFANLPNLPSTNLSSTNLPSTNLNTNTN